MAKHRTENHRKQFDPELETGINVVDGRYQVPESSADVQRRELREFKESSPERQLKKLESNKRRIQEMRSRFASERYDDKKTDLLERINGLQKLREAMRREFVAGMRQKITGLDKMSGDDAVDAVWRYIPGDASDKDTRELKEMATDLYWEVSGRQNNETTRMRALPDVANVAPKLPVAPVSPRSRATTIPPESKPKQRNHATIIPMSVETKPVDDNEDTGELLADLNEDISTQKELPIAKGSGDIEEHTVVSESTEGEDRKRIKSMKGGDSSAKERGAREQADLAKKEQLQKTLNQFKEADLEGRRRLIEEVAQATELEDVRDDFFDQAKESLNEEWDGFIDGYQYDPETIVDLVQAKRGGDGLTDFYKELVKLHGEEKMKEMTLSNVMDEYKNGDAEIRESIRNMLKEDVWFARAIDEEAFDARVWKLGEEEREDFDKMYAKNPSAARDWMVRRYGEELTDGYIESQLGGKKTSEPEKQVVAEKKELTEDERQSIIDDYIDRFRTAVDEGDSDANYQTYLDSQDDNRLTREDKQWISEKMDEIEEGLEDDEASSSWDNREEKNEKTNEEIIRQYVDDFKDAEGNENERARLREEIHDREIELDQDVVETILDAMDDIEDQEEQEEDDVSKAPVKTGASPTTSMSEKTDGGKEDEKEITLVDRYAERFEEADRADRALIRKEAENDRALSAKDYFELRDRFNKIEAEDASIDWERLNPILEEYRTASEAERADMRNRDAELAGNDIDHQLALQAAMDRMDDDRLAGQRDQKKRLLKTKNAGVDASAEIQVEATGASGIFRPKEGDGINFDDKEQKNAAVKSEKEPNRPKLENQSGFLETFWRKHVYGELVEEEDPRKKPTMGDIGLSIASGVTAGLASTFGVKSIVDLPRYATQKWFVSGERQRLREAAGISAKEGWRAGEDVGERVAKMRAAIESSKYLTAAKKEELIKKLTETLDERDQGIQRHAKQRDQDIARMIDLYVETRVKGVTVTKELVNSAAAVTMWLSGAWPVAKAGVSGARQVTQFGISMVDRWQRLSREAERGELKDEDFYQKYFVGAFGEWWSDLRGGDATTGLGKAAKTASAVGTAVRVFGMSQMTAGATLNALMPGRAEAASTSGMIDRVLDWVEKGGQVSEGEAYQRVEGEGLPNLDRLYAPRGGVGEAGMSVSREDAVGSNIDTPSVASGARSGTSASPDLLVPEQYRDSVQPSSREAGEAIERSVTESAPEFVPMQTFKLDNGIDIRFIYDKDGQPTSYESTPVLRSMSNEWRDAFKPVVEGDSSVRNMIAADVKVLQEMEAAGLADTPEYQEIKEGMIAGIDIVENELGVKVDRENSLIAKYFEGVDVRPISEGSILESIPDISTAPPQTPAEAVEILRGSVQAVVSPDERTQVFFEKDSTGRVTGMHEEVRLWPGEKARARAMIRVNPNIQEQRIRLWPSEDGSADQQISTRGWMRGRREYGQEFYRLRKIDEVLKLKERLNPAVDYSQEHEFLKRQWTTLRNEMIGKYSGKITIDKQL